jgi:hypothetical protein
VEIAHVLDTDEPVRILALTRQREAVGYRDGES